MTEILVFLACFAQVGLLTFQSINANQKRYLLGVLTSIGISCVAIYAVVHVVRDPKTYFLYYLFGNALGVFVAMKLDAHFFRRKS